MTEGFDIKIDGGAYGIKITNKGIFGDKIEKPEVAICPNCGKVDMYIKDLEKIIKNR